MKQPVGSHGLLHAGKRERERERERVKQPVSHIMLCMKTLAPSSLIP